MELYLFNNNRELAGLVESYEYLRWTRQYTKCGSFELKAIASDENIALLKIGNILWKNDDAEAGIIEYLEMTLQEQEYITVIGRFATSLLSRRIVWGTEILTGDLSAAVSQLLNNHLISPVNTDRAISGVAYTPESMGVPVSTQVSFRNLMDTITNLCDASDVGIKTAFDPVAKLFTVQLYAGFGIASDLFQRIRKYHGTDFYREPFEFCQYRPRGRRRRGCGTHLCHHRRRCRI